MVGGEKAGMGNREWGMEDRQGGECTGGGGGTATHGFAQPHRPQRTFIPYSLFPIPAPPASHIVLGNEIGRATSELQSLMRTSYAVFCLKQTNTTINSPAPNTHS